MAVNRVDWRRRRARRPCRNCKTQSGRHEIGGYRAGERSDGMRRRWTVFGGEDARSFCRFCKIDGNGFCLGATGI